MNSHNVITSDDHISGRAVCKSEFSLTDQNYTVGYPFKELLFQCTTKSDFISGFVLNHFFVSACSRTCDLLQKHAEHLQEEEIMSLLKGFTVMVKTITHTM